MTDEELKTLHKKEKNKLVRLLKKSNVDPEKVQMLIPICDNVAWMKVKLDDSKDKIKTSAICIPFENGKQKMIRENPLYKGYESLFKSYMAGMNQILAALPDKQKKEIKPAEKPRNVLELVRDKHRKEA